MKSRFSVFLLTFSILTALSLPISALLPSPSDAGLYGSVIRLHVLANSDSKEDQLLKLSVRDEVLDTVSALLYDAETKTEAEEILRRNIKKIKQKRAATAPDALQIGDDTESSIYLRAT